MFAASESEKAGRRRSEGRTFWRNLCPPNGGLLHLVIAWEVQVLRSRFLDTWHHLREVHLLLQHIQQKIAVHWFIVKKFISTKNIDQTFVLLIILISESNAIFSCFHGTWPWRQAEKYFAKIT